MHQHLLHQQAAIKYILDHPQGKYQGNLKYICLGRFRHLPYTSVLYPFYRQHYIVVEYVEMPNLVGESLTSATLKLKELGLQLNPGEEV